MPSTHGRGFLCLPALAALIVCAAPLGAPPAALAGKGAKCSRVVQGTGGADLLAGTKRRDAISAKGGADTLRGRGAGDCLRGGGGKDRIEGGPGGDRLAGGGGADRIDARDGTRDRINCGPGRDKAIVDPLDAVKGCEKVSRRAAGKSSDTTAPAVSLKAPAAGDRLGESRPTFSGSAGDSSGDAKRVAVKIYSGTSAAGGPTQRVRVARSGSRYSVAASADLAPGTYTAQALQRDAARNTGHSKAITFEIGAPSSGPSGSYLQRSHLGPIPADAHYVSTAGSDSAPGTAAEPWRTLTKAIAAAEPGDTVVIRPGTYGERGTNTYFSSPGSAERPIVFRGDPGGPMPQILGHVRISADHQTLNYMLFDGPTGPVKPASAENPDGEQVQVSIYGPAVDGVEISDSEIRNSGWHAGIYAATANGVRIVRNYIHDNGDFNDPSQANMSHGIYFSAGSGLIANNLIEHNVARGIQLYTNPHDVTIANNTVVSNGKAGIQFAAQTQNSIAVNNLVAYNGLYGIRSAELTGSGNVVEGNLVWGNGNHDLAPADGLALAGNLEQDPGFGAFGNYRPRPGSAAIDRALGPLAPPTDFDGAARPLGAGPDIGAFEGG